MRKDSPIFVAGHRGLAGSAIVRSLTRQGFVNVIVRTRDELDLTDQRATYAFFSAVRPEYVFRAAARVGGIMANATYPADFLRDNLAIELNVIDASYRAGVTKLLFLGSSCIYPKFAAQPIREESLLSAPLEPTNEAYAIAKIAGVKLCEAYWQQYGFRAISLMPTNLYGPGDNFDLQSSHVLPAMIRKFHEAREAGAESLVLWGTGTPRREFLYVDDLADACTFLMLTYDSPCLINVGSGKDITISDLAHMIAEVTCFSGRIIFDNSHPDGTPRKLLDSSRLNALGWRPQVSLRKGICRTYECYKRALASR